jgi:hypothetical protein
LEGGERTALLRELLREGPSGRIGRSCEMFVSIFEGKLCDLQLETASSSSLRVARNCGVESLGDLKGVAKGAGTRFGGTYGRLFESSIDVNKRIAALF